MLQLFQRGKSVLKVVKFLAYAALSLACVLAGVITYVSIAFPKVGPADQTLKIEITPARVKRGDYLTHHVANCYACHSGRDFEIYGMPPQQAHAFEGGFEISKILDGIPGEITTPNLTPLHLASWSDGELLRAITEGISKDGRVLFPMMPYQHYRTADQEDIYSIIAYLRTLKASGAEQPVNSLKFPFSLIAKTIPAKADFKPMPSPKDSVAYGAYLVNMVGCMDCHTPIDAHHQPLPGMEGAGGQEFKAQYKGVHVVIRPANITQDKETGIGGWTKKQFIADIRAKAEPTVKRVAIPIGEPNHIMPYEELSGMTDQDLGAIFDYLQTLKPVKNQVTRFEKL
jgi:mono/diheme cytochrome c family protein